jgi:hypothetical protein
MYAEALSRGTSTITFNCRSGMSQKNGPCGADACLFDASVDSVDSALQRWRIKEVVNVPLMSAYSIRHRVTSVLRTAKVPGEQVSRQLGHRRLTERSEARTTRGYGAYGPDYLTEASQALDV